jgi:PAS domain S-box-containing protein
MSPSIDTPADAPDGVTAPQPEREPLLTDAALRDLFVHLADAVVVADPSGTIRGWNAAAERLFGWPAADAIGRPLDLIIPERLRERHRVGYERTMATGHTSYGDRLLEVPAVHRDGRQLSIAFTVTLLTNDTDPRPYAIAAVVRDETERWQERRRMQQRLAAFERGDPPPA